MKRISNILVISLIVLTACSSTDQSLTPVVATSSSRPAATELKVLATPSSPGNSITWDNLEVTMDQLEITQAYITDYGSSRIPTEGNKFLWVHIRLINMGQIQMDVPLAEHFSILYAGNELKPTYGHRAQYPDYTTLTPTIFPNQDLDGWLRFDIPSAATLNDLRFIFLPESAQVGASYSSPNYPYADDKPTYVWKCVQ
jgi:hypothetical protein